MINIPHQKKKRNHLCEENTKKKLGLKRRRIKSIFIMCVQSFQNHLFIPKVLKSMIFKKKKKVYKALFFCRQIEQVFYFILPLHLEFPQWNYEPVVRSTSGCPSMHGNVSKNTSDNFLVAKWGRVCNKNTLMKGTKSKYEH